MTTPASPQAQAQAARTPPPARAPMALPLARVAPRPVPPTPTPRAAQIVTTARELLEREGPAALTMRRLGEVLGIRAPSLYKHLAGRTQLTARLVETALVEVGDVLHDAVDRAMPTDTVAGGADRAVDELLAAYREYAAGWPNLYRLVLAGPLPREELTAGLEEWAGEPFYRVTGEPYVGQALWAAAHGTALLELDGRYLPGSELDRTWAALAVAFGGEGRAVRVRPTRG